MIQRPQISACSLMRSTRWVSVWTWMLRTLINYVVLFGYFVCFQSIAVQVLSDPVQRMVYDEIHGYALTAVNPFLDDSTTRDHAFVDEFSCIGKFRCWDIIPFPCIEIIGSFFSWTLIISGKWMLEHYCLLWNGARCTTPCNLWVLILVRTL